jgi:serine/threonine protein kinase
MGTPACKSPESIDRVPSTTKYDIWGIGIILYQLLSEGKHPFCENDFVSDDTLYRAIREE